MRASESALLHGDHRRELERAGLDLAVTSTARFGAGSVVMIERAPKISFVMCTQTLDDLELGPHSSIGVDSECLAKLSARAIAIPEVHEHACQLRLQDRTGQERERALEE